MSDLLIGRVKVPKSDNVLTYPIVYQFILLKKNKFWFKYICGKLGINMKKINDFYVNITFHSSSNCKISLM